MKVDFEKGNGLVPAVIQNANTGKVLMLGYMNQEAFDATVDSGNVTFYSRSKERLWMKGESSGNTLKVQEMRVDCDNDSILVQAIPMGPTCHTGAETCFKDEDAKGFLYQLESTIAERIVSQDDSSYTNKLFRKGINKVAQKVGEEAVEVVIEAKDDNIELFENEAADLMYHFLLLLRAKNSGLDRIESILRDRHREKAE